MTPDLPVAARTLLKSLDGWSVADPRHATGPYAFGGLSEATNGEGKRKRTTRTEEVDSVLIRAAHVDGRAIVALFVQAGPTSKVTGKRGWTLELAWRGRHHDEHVPRQLTGTQLKAYVGAVDHAAALAAVERTPESKSEEVAA
jgi:hypothetical protein